MYRLSRAALLFSVIALLPCGTQAAGQASATVKLRSFTDPMTSALPRWFDAGDRQFGAFVGGTQSFSYENAAVYVTYSTINSNHYFNGSIRASGLKPNFWYQMKLVGKPKYGSRGWGNGGDDWANEQIGYAGRWWGDEADNQWNIDSDLEYRDLYGEVAQPDQRRTIYGYIYMAGFLTDQNGNYNGPINGNRTCHVTWQDWQDSSNQDALALPDTYLASSSGYGYGYRIDSGVDDMDNPVVVHSPVKLWYEYQSRLGRVRPNTVALNDGSYQVNLPDGHYNCRFLLTEESFHNFFGGTDEENGGFWQSVMVNEDFNSSLIPDGNPANDISFTIGTPAPDTTPPPVVAITAPSRGVTVLDSIKVTARDNFGGSGVAAVEVYLRRRNSGGAWEYWGQRSKGVWSWGPLIAMRASVDTALTDGWIVRNDVSAGTRLPTGVDLPDGAYDIYAVAQDRSLNKRVSKSVGFKVDTISPSAPVVTAPRAGARLKSLFAISGTVADNTNGSGIATVDVYLRRRNGSDPFEYWGPREVGWTWGEKVALRTKLAGSGTLFTVRSDFPAGVILPFGSDMPDGSYQTYAVAHDEAGHATTGPAIFFYIDNVGPSNVKITNPLTGSTVTTLDTISGTATDAHGVSSVRLTLRRRDSNNQLQYWSNASGTWAWSPNRSFVPVTITASNTHTVAWNVSAGTPLPSGAQLPAGPYEIGAFANDLAGNATSVTSKFSVAP